MDERQPWRCGPDAGLYSVQWDRAAERDARGLPFEQLERVLVALASLVCDPRPASAGARHGRLKGLLGLAVGRFRILYRVDDAQRSLAIARIGDRKEVYR